MIWDEVAMFEQLLLQIANYELYQTDDVFQNIIQCVMVVVDYDLIELVEVKLETDEMLMCLDVLDLEYDELKHQMPAPMPQIELIDDSDIDEVDDEVEVDIIIETTQNRDAQFVLRQIDVMLIDTIDEIDDVLEIE